MASIGRLAAMLILEYWHRKHGNEKVYPLGLRVHHGELGVILKALGQRYGYPNLSAFGEELRRDDIDDKHLWFTFKTRVQEEEIEEKLEIAQTFKPNKVSRNRKDKDKNKNNNSTKIFGINIQKLKKPKPMKF